MLSLSTLMSTYSIRMYHTIHAEKDVKLQALVTTQVHFIS